MRVNQIQQPAPVEQVQNTAPTDGEPCGGSRTSGATDEPDGGDHHRGRKAGQETGCEGYATLPWAGQGISQ